jgi:hypothetical protein
MIFKTSVEVTCAVLLKNLAVIAAPKIASAISPLLPLGAEPAAPPVPPNSPDFKSADKGSLALAETKIIFSGVLINDPVVHKIPVNSLFNKHP